MKIAALTTNSGIIFFDYHATVFQLTAEGKSYIRPPAGGTSIELNPILMSQSRYRALLLWLSENARPEFVDFTNPNGLIADGEEIENSGIAPTEPQAVATDPLTQQAIAAGYTVQAPK